MGGRLLPKIPLGHGPRLLAAQTRAELFSQVTACRRLRTYTTSNHFPWQASRVQQSRTLNVAISPRPHFWSARRLKSGYSQGKQERTSESEETPQFGDEPALYDGKPPFWARWVFFLLALDVLFVGFSADMVMRNWTRPVETPSSSNAGKKYEIRPLWQRLALASFEVVIGSAAGALILASRDRTVWRIRIRRIPVNSGGSIASKRPSSTSPKARTTNVLVLETGSGRTKRFIMRDATLMPGRDLSELFLGIPGIRGRFTLPMNGARVLGSTADAIGESKVLKELLTTKEHRADAALINSIPAGASSEIKNLAELRRALAQAWIQVGGILSVPSPTTQKGGWTSGPITEGTR